MASKSSAHVTYAVVTVKISLVLAGVMIARIDARRKVRPTNKPNFVDVSLTGYRAGIDNIGSMHVTIWMQMLTIRFGLLGL